VVQGRREEFEQDVTESVDEVAGKVNDARKTSTHFVVLTGPKGKFAISAENVLRIYESNE
jgi:hypothetical protein